MVIIAAAAIGFHISAARNAAARSSPTAIAAGMSRPDLGGGVVRDRAALGGGAPRRRPCGPVGARRGMPDGSVPMVMRLGSRAATSGSADTRRFGPVTAGVGDAAVLTGGAGRHGLDHRCDGLGRLVVLPHRRLGRERRPHVELVLVTGVLVATADVEAGHLTGGRLGPVGQRTGVAVAEADLARGAATLDLLEVLRGLCVVEQRAVLAEIVAVPTIAPHVVAHPVSLSPNPQRLTLHARQGAPTGRVTANPEPRPRATRLPCARTPCRSARRGRA